MLCIPCMYVCVHLVTAMAAISVHAGMHTLLYRFLFMALEGEGSQMSSSSSSSSSERAGDGGGGGGSEDSSADKKRGLSDTIKELFAGRLMNYVEVRSLARK